MVNEQGERMPSNDRTEQTVTLTTPPATYRHWPVGDQPPLARLTLEMSTDVPVSRGTSSV